MFRRRHHFRNSSRPVTVALLAGILVAGPLAAPASAWSSTGNPTPSDTVGFSNVHSEGAQFKIIGGPMKVRFYVPDHPQSIPAPAGAIGQHVTVRTVLEKRIGKTLVLNASTKTQEVRLLGKRRIVTVNPGEFSITDANSEYRIKYVVTWRWLTSKHGKPLPKIARFIIVNPTGRQDATCVVYDIGACSVDRQGWIKLGVRDPG